MSGITWFFCDGFLLANILRFIHYIACIYLFLFTAKQYSTGEMYYILYIHLPADGHLGCFQACAIKNNAAVNIHVHPSCGQTFSFLLGQYL